MRLHRHASAAATVALAALLSVSACSASAGKPPTRHVRTAATTSTAGHLASAASITQRLVHFTAYTDNDGPTSTVVLSGAIGDYGKAQSVNPDGSVNSEHNSQLNVVLSRGSFRLDIAGLDKKFVAAVADLQVDTTTCSGHASVSGPVPVVAGKGTGQYQRIRGTFRLTISLDEVDQPAGCSQNSPLLAQAIVIAGPGTITVG